MKIAITGGIGSGKSYVCRLLESMGISVYDCDAAAKRLMRDDRQLRLQLMALVGPQVYNGAQLQKNVLAQFLLKSEANKQAVNNIVHPAVARDFEQSGIDWLESAILFDSGFYRRTRFDCVVCVVASEETRLSRIMSRDHIGREKAQEWMRAQMPQEEVMRLSDYVITNDGQYDLQEQIGKTIELIKNKQKTV